MKFYRVTYSYKGAFGKEITEEIDYDHLEDALLTFLNAAESCRKPSITLMDMEVGR